MNEWLIIVIAVIFGAIPIIFLWRIEDRRHPELKISPKLSDDINGWPRRRAEDKPDDDSKSQTLGDA